MSSDNLEPVIDVHTHMFDTKYLQLLREKGGIDGFDFRVIKGSNPPLKGIYHDGALFCTPMPGHLDYDLRVRDMDAGGVDLAIVSATAPSVYWGGKAVSTEAAMVLNDSHRTGQRRHPNRIRYLATLPWEYPDNAIKELNRICDSSEPPAGVFVLANVNGKHLIDPHFAEIWKEIDRRGMPVLVHPHVPPGDAAMDMTGWSLASTVGFMFDTTLAISKMVMSGFCDEYPNLKIIAAHAGATIPYLAGRMDRSYEMTIPAKDHISRLPSDYLKNSNIYYDAVTYQLSSLKLCIEVGGVDKVMYGSDYPHDIGDMKGVLGRVDELPADQRKAVRGQNALRIFNLSDWTPRMGKSPPNKSKL